MCDVCFLNRPPICGLVFPYFCFTFFVFIKVKLVSQPLPACRGCYPSPAAGTCRSGCLYVIFVNSYVIMAEIAAICIFYIIKANLLRHYSKWLALCCFFNVTTTMMQQTPPGGAATHRSKVGPVRVLTLNTCVVAQPEFNTNVTFNNVCVNTRVFKIYLYIKKDFLYTYNWLISL